MFVTGTFKQGRVWHGNQTMTSSDIDVGKKAAYLIYKQLREEGISSTVAFRVAVEKCHQVSPNTPPVEVEAAVWEAIQDRITEELETMQRLHSDRDRPVI